MSLNKQLAVEVMRWEEKPDYSPPYLSYYKDKRGKLHGQVRNWNPRKDLEQLSECYHALTQEQKATYKQLVVDHDVQSVFESPGQHAELILKAKGVI